MLDPGDIWYPPKRYMTTSVKMTFEKGAAVKIEGGWDARMIREYIEGWQDPEGYMISHIGFGGHRRGLWNARAVPGSARHHRPGRAHRVGHDAVRARLQRDFRRHSHHRLSPGLRAQAAAVLPRRRAGGRQRRGRSRNTSSRDEVGSLQLRATRTRCRRRCAILDEHAGGARVLAGGQSLVPMLQMRLMQLRRSGRHQPAAEASTRCEPRAPETVFGPMVRYATIERLAARFGAACRCCSA